MKKSTYNLITFSLIALAVAAVAVYYLPSVNFFGDETADLLFKDVLLRVFVAALGVFLVATSKCKDLLTPKIKRLPVNLLIILPCIAVALVNFPFSALISGKATVERYELIPLLFIECVAIGVFEETFFRALLTDYVADKLKNTRYNVFWTVIISSAVFAAWHLFNLFAGASVGGTMLQLLYTFLLGAMFSFVTISTGDIWLPIALHAVFDFGGALVSRLGTGEFQDAIFWILTLSVGTLCGVYVFIGLIRLQKKETADRNVQTD